MNALKPSRILAQRLLDLDQEPVWDGLRIPGRAEWVDFYLVEILVESDGRPLLMGEIAQDRRLCRIDTRLLIGRMKSLVHRGIAERLDPQRERELRSASSEQLVKAGSSGWAISERSLRRIQTR